MSSQRQIEANRLNAQKSTGPCTPEGKAVSSQNALKSGLDAESQFVYGESREEFAALQHEYFTRFQPLTPEERFYVDMLIRNEWTLRRLFRAESHLWEHQVIRANRSEGTPLGAALIAADQVFSRLHRRITLAERSFKEALAELARLQQTRGPVTAAQTSPEPLPSALPDDSQPQPDTGDTAESGSFLNSPADSQFGRAGKLPDPA